MSRQAKQVREGSGSTAAPWQLRAEGYLMLVRARAGVHTGKGHPPTGCVLFVDYSQAPVGPYRELLFIPQLFGSSEQNPSIQTIYVSTQESVVAGRRNWGIPKELATFEVTTERRTQTIAVSVQGERAFQLEIEPSRLSVPFTTTLLPARLRTLHQVLDGTRYTTKPEAHGLLHTAKVRKLVSESAHFPALSATDVLFAAQLSHVRMKFPRAKVLHGNEEPG